MCGGYTRICVQCGRCGSVKPRPLSESGACVRCGHQNDPGATACGACGAKLPQAPGAPQPTEINVEGRNAR